MVIGCSSGSATVDPAAGPGRLADGAGITQSTTAPVLFGASVFRGTEPLAGAGKVYWNVALGLELGTPAAAGCTLTTTGTAAAGPLAGDATPSGSTYPVIGWSVPLTTTGDALTCTSHPVNGGNGVAVRYAAPDAPETFAHSFDGGAATSVPAATGLPSCAHVLAADPSAQSGVYSLDPDGPGAAPPHDAYCDMTTDGGGWTLVQVKTSTDFVMTTTGVDPACASAISGDCASAVDPRLPWAEALWRFADSDSPLVSWYRGFSDAPGGLASYLGGYDVSGQGVSVGGFDRYLGGAWSGLATIPLLYYGVETASPLSTGLSEAHSGGSDRWLDLWNVPDSSVNYLSTENGDTTLYGTKCIAGVCRAAPVWMLVRDPSVCGAACGQTALPRSCAALLGAAPGTLSGTYTIDPDGLGGEAPFDAYCDMATDGGGWTLVSTKVTPSFVGWASAFVPACAASPNADCASAVHPEIAWTQAQWRFGVDTAEGERVEWARDDAVSFSDYLRGASISGDDATVGGFSKTVSGVTTAGHSIASFYYHTVEGVSEQHAAGSDQWLDLWNAADTSSSYSLDEGGDLGLLGTKCVAGYCRSAPVWLMVRDPHECGAACGLAPTSALPSCAAILAADANATSGLYTIDSDGDGGVAPYSAYCDMTTDGGGWTLVQTKVSPSLVPWSASFDPACASATASDCASAVAPYLAYDDVLWRFADNADVIVRWAASTHVDLRAFFGGAALDVVKTPVTGFSKTVDGVYTGPYTIAMFYFRAAVGLSEDHAAGSDQWLDLWTTEDTYSNQYLVTENGDTSLRGTKCLAGYCRSAPVWMMVR